MAAGLSRLLAELSPETGLILTTRDSALPAAEQLHLPLVRLETPGNLEDTMHELIRAMAPSVVIDPAGRDEWIATRKDELNAAFGVHDDVWDVPLLATLATIRLARGRTSTSSVAVLLNEVIQDSVTEWELRRAWGRDDLDPAVRSEMILDGFAAIGHRLISETSISSTDAKEAVRESLRPWSLAAPLESTFAAQIVNFWDERVGIFVHNGEAIVPRSRQFAELAEVRWLSNQDEDHRRAWLHQAITDEAYGNAVSLATSIDPVIRTALIKSALREGAMRSRDRAATWVARYWDSWPAEDPVQLRHVIDALADAAEDRLLATIDSNGFLRGFEQSRQCEDGGGWEFVLALLHGPQHLDVDAHRRERIDGLDLAPPRRSIVTALAGLIDAKEAGIPLDPETIEAVEQVINSPRPAPSESGVNDDGVLEIGASEGYVTGVGEIVVRSIDYLAQLSSDAPDTLHRIGKRLSMGKSERISRRLIALGHPDPEPLELRHIVSQDWEDSREDHHSMGWMLRQLDQLAPADHPPRQVSWRYAELGRLMGALRFGKNSMGGFIRATQEDGAILQPWLAAHIEAFQLDGGLIAQEARHLLTAPDAEGASDSLMFGRLQPDTKPTLINEPTALILVPAFTSRSGWIVNRSFRLLMQTRYPSVATALSDLVGLTSWRSRFERNIVIILNSSDPQAIVIELIKSNNTAIRAAVGAILDGGFISRPDLLDRLRTDPDGQVRYYADGDPETAETWTCESCGHGNPAGRTSCVECRNRAPWR